MLQVLDTLIKTSDGDLRRAITYLQSASRLHSAAEKRTPVTPRSIVEIAGVVPDEVIRALGSAIGVPSTGDEDESMAPGTTKKLDGFERVRAVVKSVAREGYSTSQLLIQVGLLHTSLSHNLLLTDTSVAAPRLHHGTPVLDGCAQGTVRT